MNFSTKEKNIIEIRDVFFDYSEKKKNFSALKGIDLTIREGEFVCILGASGCGKSTLLSLLNGLNRPKSGEILINGKAVSGPGVDRAVVFQQYSLFPWLTAKGNVLFGLKQNRIKRDRKQQSRLADRYLESVGLLEFANKYPGQLSGGQQQRVAVARALAIEPDILLMDEPFGAIDPKLRLELQELVSRLSSSHNKTVVFVTHDIDEAMLLADRVVVMDLGVIRSVVDIDLPRPRKKSELIKNGKYTELHRQLMSGYYEKIRENIYQEVSL